MVGLFCCANKKDARMKSTLCTNIKQKPHGGKLAELDLGSSFMTYGISCTLDLTHKSHVKSSNYGLLLFS